MDNYFRQNIRTQFKDKTIITIAHRLETVMDSDKIVSLIKGIERIRCTTKIARQKGRYIL